MNTTEITSLCSHTQNWILEPSITYDKVVQTTNERNEAPVPNRFTNAFKKIFITEISHWVHKALIYLVSNKTIPDLTINGSLTCIPKVGKLRNNLKDWRPLSLLNVIYFFSNHI